MNGKHDDDKKSKTYKFFVGSEKYETTEHEQIEERRVGKEC